MKTFLLFLMLFSAAILLLPMTALDLSEPKTEFSSAAIVIRQEESLPPPAQETRPVMETVKTVHWDEPDCFSVLDRSRNEIIEVPVLDYLYGAVAAEMPPTFHPEALKAQAVTARTYALRKQNTSSFYDGGYAYVELNGKYGVINTEGELVVPAMYDKLERSL